MHDRRFPVAMWHVPSQLTPSFPLATPMTPNRGNRDLSLCVRSMLSPACQDMPTHTVLAVSMFLLRVFKAAAKPLLRPLFDPRR